MFTPLINDTLSIPNIMDRLIKLEEICQGPGNASSTNIEANRITHNRNRTTLPSNWIRSEMDKLTQEIQQTNVKVSMLKRNISSS